MSYILKRVIRYSLDYDPEQREQPHTFYPQLFHQRFVMYLIIQLIDKKLTKLFFSL